MICGDTSGTNPFFLVFLCRLKWKARIVFDEHLKQWNYTAIPNAEILQVA